VALSSSELTISQEVILLLINAPFVSTLNVFDIFRCLVRAKIMVNGYHFQFDFVLDSKDSGEARSGGTISIYPYEHVLFKEIKAQDDF